MNEQAWIRWVIQTARSWRDVSSIVRTMGVNQVDADHRRLAEYALELNLLLQSGSGKAGDLDLMRGQRDLIRSIHAYAREHFDREEELMSRTGLSGLETQKLEHGKILEMLRRTEEEFDAGRTTITLSLRQAILEWVIDHINTVDFRTLGYEQWKPVIARARAWPEVEPVVRATGSSLIDGQHRRIIDHILEIIRYQDKPGARRNGSWRKGAAECLARLRACAQQHFTEEEELIRRYGLPGLELQAAQHAELLADIGGGAKDSASGLNDAAAGIGPGLLDKWLRHMNGPDHEALSLQHWASRILGKGNKAADCGWLIQRTGVKMVDDDHGYLFDITFRLGQIAEKPDSPQQREECLKALAEIMDFASAHFGREEALMRETGNPMLEKHLRAHQDLVKTLAGIASEVRSGLVLVSAGLKVRLLDWWLNHTNGMDVETFGKEGIS